MENGDQQLLLTTIQMLEVIKEALPTMAGRALKMTPWAWEGEEVEVMVWGVSLEAGAALEEARVVERAPEADPAQTEMLTSQKEETAEKVPHQYCQLCLGLIWIQGFCPTLDGDRRPYGRTPPGMSLLPLPISTRVPEVMKENMAVEEAPDGEQQRRQLPPRPLEVGGVGQAAQAQVQEALVGESDQPLAGTAKAQQVEVVGRATGMMEPTTRGATATPVIPGAIT